MVIVDIWGLAKHQAQAFVATREWRVLAEVQNMPSSMQICAELDY